MKFRISVMLKYYANPNVTADVEKSKFTGFFMVGLLLHFFWRGGGNECIYLLGILAVDPPVVPSVENKGYWVIGNWVSGRSGHKLCTTRVLKTSVCAKCMISVAVHWRYYDLLRWIAGTWTAGSRCDLGYPFWQETPLWYFGISQKMEWYFQ